MGADSTAAGAFRPELPTPNEVNNLGKLIAHARDYDGGQVAADPLTAELSDIWRFPTSAGLLRCVFSVSQRTLRYPDSRLLLETPRDDMPDAMTVQAYEFDNYAVFRSIRQQTARYRARVAPPETFFQGTKLDGGNHNVQLWWKDPQRRFRYSMTEGPVVSHNPTFTKQHLVFLQHALREGYGAATPNNS